MLLHIANYMDADRLTAKAGEALTLGQVVKVTGVSGVRTLTFVRDAEAAALVAGRFGVAFKVSSEELQVATSTVPVDFAGSRLNAIASGDWIALVGPGAILEYDLSILHASLDPARAGVLPAIGDALGVKDGLFCRANVASAIVSPVIGRVYDILAGKVRVQLLDL